MAISEIAAVSGLKIGRYRQLIPKMKVSTCKYLPGRSRSSLALGPRHLHMKIKTFFL